MTVPLSDHQPRGITAVRCPVHGAGYGRCLGCLLEAGYAIRHIQVGYPIIVRRGDLWTKKKEAA